MRSENHCLRAMSSHKQLNDTVNEDQSRAAHGTSIICSFHESKITFVSKY